MYIYIYVHIYIHDIVIYVVMFLNMTCLNISIGLVFVFCRLQNGKEKQVTMLVRCE